MSEEITPIEYIFTKDENGEFVFWIETDEDYADLSNMFDEDE